MSNLARAIEIAASAHKDQVRKSGLPYVLHPLRLMFRFTDETAMMAAVLHDVVEDTPWTFDALRAEGFSDDLLAALDCLTHRDGESYDEYVDRIAGNAVARRVKIADLEDNMNLKELPEVTDKILARTQKYHRHWLRLKAME